MKTQKHYFAIGFFVLLGFAIFAIACALFGGGKLFAKKVYFETYFPTSVEGLSVGSSVKFRGIELGAVETITIAGDTYKPTSGVAAETCGLTEKTAYVRVVCSLDIERHPNLTEEALKTMVANGLQTKLTSAGITGGAFISLDFARHATAEVHAVSFSWEPEHVYIPSAPSTLQNVMNVVDDLTEQIERIDLNRTTDALNQLIETLNRNVENAKIDEFFTSATQVLRQLSEQLATLQVALEEMDGKGIATDLKTISGNLAQISTDLREGIPTLTDSANTTLQQLEVTLRDTSELLDEATVTLNTVQDSVDPELISRDIEETLTTLTRTAASLEALVNEIRQKPSRIIFDDPLN